MVSTFEVKMDIIKLDEMWQRDIEEVYTMDVDIRFYGKDGKIVDGVHLEKLIVERVPRVFRGVQHAISNIALDMKKICLPYLENEDA